MENFAFFPFLSIFDLQKILCTAIFRIRMYESFCSPALQGFKTVSKMVDRGKNYDRFSDGMFFKLKVKPSLREG